MSIPLCIHCKHRIYRNRGNYCGNPRSRLFRPAANDPVTGRPAPSDCAPCWYERKDWPDRCGPTGRWFEARRPPSIWARIREFIDFIGI